MKPLERLAAVFAFEEPDRVPIFDKLRNEQVITHYAGEHFVPERAMEISLKACRMALDCTGAINYPQVETTETTRDGFVWLKERWTSWIKDRPFCDIAGLAVWVRQEIERLEGFDPRAGGRSAAQLKRRAELQSALGDTVFLFGGVKVGLNDAYHHAGLELFSFLMADDPALVSRWLEAAFRANQRIFEALAPNPSVCPIALIGEDIAGRTATLFSPAFLRQEFFPRLRELVQMYHDSGLKVIYHSDGNLNRVMGDLVAAEIDGLNPIEIQAGMDLRSLKERYGRRLVLVGGMDASGLLPQGSVEDVRAATREALRVAAPGSGYILGSTTELSDAIPPENIIAMWETTRELGRYPLAL